MPGEPLRALLVRLPNPLGDVVMALPLLAELRRSLPHARLLAAGAEGLAPLLAGCDELDAFVPLPLAARRGPGAVPRQAALLRGAAADAILLLPNSWSSALAARLAGIPRRLGRRGAGRGGLLTAALPPIAAPAPMTELYGDLLPLLGLTRPARMPPARLRAMQSPPPPLADAAAGPWLGVAPGAAFGPSKLYAEPLLLEAVARAVTAHGLRPVWIGAPGERERLERLAARAAATMGAAPVVVCGDLGAAAAALAACRVVLAMDNGARHLAAALGVPQAVVYGPTHPAWSAHALERTEIVRREDLPCLACHRKRCPLADHPCMRALPAVAVADAIGRALLSAAPAAPRLEGLGGPCRI